MVAKPFWYCGLPSAKAMLVARAVAIRRVVAATRNLNVCCLTGLSFRGVSALPKRTFPAFDSSVRH